MGDSLFDELHRDDLRNLFPLLQKLLCLLGIFRVGRADCILQDVGPDERGQLELGLNVLALGGLATAWRTK